MQIPEIPSEIDIESGALGDLLDKLLRGSYFAKEVVDQTTGELILDGLLRVQINNVPYHGLPKGLATELRNGDTVTLSLVLIGGG